jgi:hypothetical protein
MLLVFAAESLEVEASTANALDEPPRIVAMAKGSFDIVFMFHPQIDLLDTQEPKYRGRVRRAPRRLLDR